MTTKFPTEESLKFKGMSKDSIQRLKKQTLKGEKSTFKPQYVTNGLILSMK